ncbi:MAG: T9SS type A sorting domain-containing protein, partial [Sphingobacteriales bacterium]
VEVVKDRSAVNQDDSTYFRYSGTRGSSFDYDGTYHNYYFPQGDPGLDALTFGDITVQADTIKYWSINGPNMTLSEDISISYTSSNKVLDYMYKDMSNLAGSQRAISVYDAQGRVSTMIGMEWSPTLSQWDTSAKRILTYNTQNQVVTDSIFSYSLGDWLPAQVFEYTYNSAGKLAEGVAKVDYMGTFLDIYSTEISYYPNNTIKDVVTNVNQSGVSLDPYQRDSFAYAPANGYASFHQTWAYDNTTSEFIPDSRITRNSNAQGLPDTTHYYSWDGTGWVNEMYNTASYNSYANPVTIKTYEPTGANFDQTYLYNFYYELYNDATPVATIPQEHQISVYPNPATDNVNIFWKGNEGNRVALRIVNASGQLVKTEMLNWNQTTEQVNISNLSNGVYFLTISDNTGTMVYKHTIIKN